jgi:cyclopropane fatty-acyl-phospholipid synthase-like methyltransferase
MISDEYRSILQELNGKENFGKRKKLPKFLDSIIDFNKPKSILDFGCGTGSLVGALRNKYSEIQIEGYDPGNEKFSNTFENEKFDLIISTDVLEHIEPLNLDPTLNFLKLKSNKFYHLIALSPSRVFLPDGRNAHLIIESKDWWKEKFLQKGYKINFEYHMYHKKNDRYVNKYFISGFC